MTRQEKTDTQNKICDKCDCGDKQRERHVRLFVDEGWQVHVSRRFRAWWAKHPDFITSKEISGVGTSAMTAQNCKRYWEEHLDAKGIGIA